MAATLDVPGTVLVFILHTRLETNAFDVVRIYSMLHDVLVVSYDDILLLGYYQVLESRRS